MRRSVAPSVVTAVVVITVMGITVWALHPSLLLSTTTITGGDTGSHVGLAWYLKTQLLPHFHLTGWDPGAYDGFPLYTFYFPLPDLLAALGGYVMPFTVAFKLATILGSLTLPVAAWAFGRLAGLERPRPAVLAAATLPFLFDQTFTIYGGNLYSTMAGEYAYSLGLSAALVFLGLVVRGLRTGRYRALAALLLAFCVLSHLIAAILALAGLVIAVLLLGVTKRRLWWVATVVGTGGLLVAWWAVPFVLEQPYSTNMGWLNVTTYAGLLAPAADRWALVVAGIGVVFALVRRERVAIMVAVLGGCSAGALLLDPQGKLYNTRFLPLWWLCIYLVAGYAAAEIGVLIASWWRYGPYDPALAAAGLQDGSGGRPQALVNETGAIGTGLADPPFRLDPPAVPAGPTGVPRRRGPFWAPGAVAVPLVCLAAACAVVLPPLLIGPSSSYRFGPLHLTPDNVPSWANWNYSGYQAMTGWNEFHRGIIDTLDEVSAKHGCGRAMWEYSSDENRFGTPEALMMLPYFTNNCIDSMEGLLFESASSTPYHFINQSELSAGPSDAMVGLPYKGLNVSEGIKHLQLMGVRYFIAETSSVEAQADANPALTLVGSSGPWRTAGQTAAVGDTWKVYLVSGSSMVAPLTHEPTVLTGVGPQESSWLPVALKWYDKPSAWAHELVAGGPSNWPRQSAAAAMDSTGAPLPTVHVTDIHSTAQSVSFHVDRTGVPVLVRISYFPNWHVSGGMGPWRAEPNLMVVVPTSHNVSLSYGSSPAGWLGLGLSLVGLIMLVMLVRRRNDV